MTAVVMSILPIETTNYNDPIIDWCICIPSLSRRSVVLSSGWSPFSSLDFYFDDGFLLNIFVYTSIIFSAYFFGAMHRIPLSSLKSHKPSDRIYYLWLLVCICIFFNEDNNSFGSRTTKSRSSTYTAIYSHSPSDYLIHVSGSALHGEKPLSRRSSEDLLYHLVPPDRGSYNALYIINSYF